MHALMMPRLGQTMTKGKLIEWLIDVGAPYQEGALLYTIETDKTVIEVEATVSGRLLRRLIEPDEEVPVGTYVGVAADNGEVVSDDQVTSFVEQQKTPTNSEAAGERDVTQTADNSGALQDRAETRGVPTERSRAMPNVRRRAKELGVDLDDLKAVTGKSGLITKQDVEEFAARQPVPSQAKSQTSPRSHGMQAAMARQMSRSWAIPQFGQDMEVDIAPLRKRAERLAAQGTPASLASLIMDVFVRALRVVPLCNAVYDNDAITQDDAINMGVAVATDRGLVVPVLRNCQDMDLMARTKAMDTLVLRARSGALTPDDLDGGTVTLSMLNNTRVQTGVPILNAPQVCLLFCGCPTKKPIVKDDQVVIGETIHLVAVYDHRVIDGMTGAKFMDALYEGIAAS